MLFEPKTMILGKWISIIWLLIKTLLNIGANKVNIIKEITLNFCFIEHILTLVKF